MRVTHSACWLSFCLLTLLLIWNPTEFRTKILLSYDGQNLHADLGQQSFSISRPGLSIKRLTLQTGPSFIPNGGDRIIWIADQTDPVIYRLPSRFEFSKLNYKPAGDWWIDERYATEEVWAKTLEYSGSFKMEVWLKGRFLQFVKLGLEGEQGVSLALRRGLLNNDVSFNEPDGPSIDSIMLIPVWTESFLHIIDPYLRGLWIASLFALILAYLPATVSTVTTASSSSYPRLLWIIALLYFLFSCWVAVRILDAMPHFQDDMCYLLRAKWLLAGQPYPDAPALAEHFQIPYTYFSEGKWATLYPIGWSLFLALGEYLGAPWLLSPLCGALGLLVFWKIGELLGGKKIAVVTLLMTVTCMLCWIFSASMMTHAISPLLIALSVWCFYRGENNGLPFWSFYGGLALGILFGIRPLTSVGIGLVLALFALGRVKTTLRQSLAFAGGVFAGALPVLIDNWIVTGKPWLFAYSVGFEYSWTWKTIGINLLTTDSTMALIVPHAFHWPLPLLGLGLVFTPFLAGHATRLHWILLAVFFSVPIAYSGINFSGGHGFGPRYYFDVIFCLFLLAAHGFVLISQTLSRLPNLILSKSWLIAGLFFLCCAGIKTITDLSRYKNYNNIDSRLSKALEENQIKRGLVLIPLNDEMSWVLAAPKLPGKWQDDLIFAWDLEENSGLFRQFPDRRIYLWKNNRLVQTTPPPLASPSP